ncbi:glycosyltransferase [Deinococcus yunweiensis]|uniref:glycosyltransferase n=1 Tax=Deinococcus yunweiensis TaxID=367282 RepID=UPI00398F79EB
MPSGRVVFWQPNFSPHQFDLIDALSRHENGYVVELCLSRQLNSDRKVFGWSKIHYEHVNIHESPNAMEIEALTSEQAMSSVHVFSGIANDIVSKQALEACIRYGATIFIMSEAGDWNGHGYKKYIRLVKHLMLRKKYGRYIHTILPMGKLGVNWFKRLGYKSDRIVSFGYFVESDFVSVAEPETFQILFVGRAVKYKGGDLLVRALGKIKHLRWHATFLTQGTQRAIWEGMAKSLGLQERITFHDYETSLAYAQRMASASVLVQPNIGDEGWGAVVNEALMQGTPVICTTLTGAQDMVCSGFGAVIVPDVDSLVQALERQIQNGVPNAERRAKISDWTRQYWSGEAGAHILATELNNVFETTYDS